MEPVNGRQYKSRKSRPCDFCRKRKVACHMEHGPPCGMCRERATSCTFTKGPGRRTRPVRLQPSEGGTSKYDPRHLPASSSSKPLGNDTIDTDESPGIPHPHIDQNPQGIQNDDFDLSMHHNMDDLLDMFNYEGAHPHNLTYPNSPIMPRDDIGSPREDDPVQTSPHLGRSIPIPSSISQITNSTTSPLTEFHPSPQNSIKPQESLENLSGASSRFIGFTGELDVYLLQHRQYDANNQSCSQYTNVIYQRMQSPHPLSEINATRSLPPQIFAIMNDVHTDKAEPRLDTSVLEQNEREFRDMISDEIAESLIRLYYRFVDPYFPIMSRSQCPPGGMAVQSLPMSLLAALCATAIPFIIYDDDLCVQLPRAPSVTHLFRISWLAITQELHTPRLSTLQACLLMLQRHATDLYVADSPFKWTLMGITVAAAQTLGLNRDPMDWASIPLWERRLRKRLWWAMWIMEKFTALGQGMPTHLLASNCDVDLLTADDFEFESIEMNESSGLNSHFYHLMTLTIILDDIVNTYYTVLSVKKTANNFKLSLDLAKQARAKLKDWHDHLPQNLRNREQKSSANDENSMQVVHELDGNSSLRLAYIVTQMTLFRALLRPISSSPHLNLSSNNRMEFDGAQAVMTGAITCVKELVEFVESLTGIEWDAFWHSWSRHNFAIASTFLMQLLFITQAHQQSTSSDAESVSNEQHALLQNLVRRWRWAMRVSARGAGGNKGLMNLSLLRIDALFTEWQKGSGYGFVVKGA